MKALKLNKWISVRKFVKDILNIRICFLNKYAGRKLWVLRRVIIGQNIYFHLSPSGFCHIAPNQKNEKQRHPSSWNSSPLPNFSWCQVVTRIPLQAWTWRAKGEKWTLWIRSRFQFPEPFCASRQAGDSDMRLVVHVFHRLGWLWMVFQAVLFLVVKSQALLSAQVWMEFDIELVLIHQFLTVGT